MSGPPLIAIAGAGSVGCLVGGRLALAGRRVTLLGRESLMSAIAAHGLAISDRDGRDAAVSPDGITASTDPSALGGADIVLVTVKSGGTNAMADLIAAHAPPNATVVSLQNGIGNPARLAARLGPHVLAGMVPFNVVLSQMDGRLHVQRASSGRVHVAAGRPDVVSLLDVPGLPTIAHADMHAVAWSKLVMNLNNALNALSGLPLRDQLADRRWRRLLAAQAAEALRAIRAGGKRTTRIDGVDPRLIPFVLRLPDFAFRLFARRMLTIGPTARSSMWDDLEKRRPTEIDELQGAVVALAQATDTPAPTCAHIRRLVRQAEAAGSGSPRLSPDEVAP